MRHLYVISILIIIIFSACSGKSSKEEGNKESGQNNEMQLSQDYKQRVNKIIDELQPKIISDTTAVFSYQLQQAAEEMSKIGVYAEIFDIEKKDSVSYMMKLIVDKKRQSASAFRSASSRNSDNKEYTIYITINKNQIHQIEKNLTASKMSASGFFIFALKKSTTIVQESNANNSDEYLFDPERKKEVNIILEGDLIDWAIESDTTK